MEVKLDLILKELQDLNLRVDELKSKCKEETLENVILVGSTAMIEERMRALADLE